MNASDDQKPARTVVRRATVDDIRGVVMLGRKFADESGYPSRGIHINPHKLHESLELAIGDDSHAVFVADRDGVLVGASAAIRFSMYFSDAPVAMEMFWWVDPEVRGGTAAIRLIKSMEDWAAEAGCITFSMVDLPGIIGPASSIYERRGYQLVERTWIKGMN